MRARTSPASSRRSARTPARGAGGPAPSVEGKDAPSSIADSSHQKSLERSHALKSSMPPARPPRGEPRSGATADGRVLEVVGRPTTGCAIITRSDSRAPASRGKYLSLRGGTRALRVARATTSWRARGASHLGTRDDTATMAGILAGAFARSTPGTGRGISPRPVRGFCYPAGEHPPRRPRASCADDPATPPLRSPSSPRAADRGATMMKIYHASGIALAGASSRIRPRAPTPATAREDARPTRRATPRT